MRICYDTLENFKLTKGGHFTKDDKSFYIERSSCKLCGEPYLTYKYKQSDYCSTSCARTGENNNFYGKKHTNSTKVKISTSKLGKNLGPRSATWRGGLGSVSLPLYDTYAPKLNFVENVSYYEDALGIRILEVHCTKCDKVFIPSLHSVKARLGALNGRVPGEARLYCSEQCKKTCSIYNKRAIDYLDIHKTSNFSHYTRYELRIWSKEVLTRANYVCYYCGGQALHAHHIIPKILDAFSALDPDNGVAVCVTCHYKYGHIKNCSIHELMLYKC
jgi:hypothetical protein